MESLADGYNAKTLMGYSYAHIKSEEIELISF